MTSARPRPPASAPAAAGGLPRVTLVAPPAKFMTAVYAFRTQHYYRNQLPLGIGYVAALLRREGVPVTLIDAEARGWDLDRAVDGVLATRPDVVGISAITMEASGAYALARALRARSDVTLVLGGAHANSYYEKIPAECPTFDAVVVGDGEYTMLDICRAVARGEGFEAIRGLRCKRPDGSWTRLKRRKIVEDLDSLPPPAYDLYEHHLYRPLPHRHKRSPSTCIITSRGCSYGKCIYCEMSAYGRRRFRRHSPARVVDEIRTLVRLTGARELYFQDDIFITEEAWVEEFCEQLREADLDLIWSCETRFDDVPESLFRAMREAGCWRVYFGLESGDQELLDTIRKGFTVADARAAVGRARRAGLEVVGFFMLGLPGATREREESTVRLATSLGLEHAMFSLTVPHRNTELYDVCEDMGTVLRDDEYNIKRAAYLPHGYRSQEDLEAFQREAYRRFYLRPRYVLERLRAIKSVDDLRYLARGALALTRFLE